MSTPAAVPRLHTDHITVSPWWTTVDEFSISHLHPDSRPNIAALDQATRHASDSGLPSISVSRSFGKFLALQCKASRAKHMLEVGTLGGYSSIWFATENPDLKVTTVEYSPKHAAVARESHKSAGVDDRITVLEGAGVDVLPTVLADVQAGKKEKIGFAFIDADKPNNYTYFDYAVQMAGKGAIIVVDNAIAKGHVSHERSDIQFVEEAKKVIENVGKDKRVDATVMQTVDEDGYDGFIYAIVL
ncbi:putative o-methyltransferase family 3 [Phaeomoniella chlamydospora]|uniref:Putative o-methyltransferase family 3 n=1 Tax=Phaeomoniella chlamydospora TaxID=158046 RepID=A0A0G2E4D1_PHACM|nr:putative o-methyltransferase family 3 [Phaeomoniella chlamydospora]